VTSAIMLQVRWLYLELGWHGTPHPATRRSYCLFKQQAGPV